MRENERNDCDSMLEVEEKRHKETIRWMPAIRLEIKSNIYKKLKKKLTI